MLRYRRRLLDHLRHDDYTPRRLAALIEDLQIPDDERSAFEKAVNDLATGGVLHITDDGFIDLPSLLHAGDHITGIMKRNQRGFGFVEPERHVREGAVFIPPDDTGGALTGDTVRCRIRRDMARERESRGAGGPQFIGQVVEVVKRKKRAFSGEVGKRGTFWVVHPDGKDLTEPILLRDADSKNVREGDKVVVEIVAYPEPGMGGTTMLAEGVITRVLGDAGKPDVETQAVILTYSLPGEFPEECVEQAREASERYDAEIAEYQKRGPEALDNRRDLTGDYIITIDPPDAKDYDDAISIRRSATVPNGWDVGVHIADVAHFIDRASPLDLEARERANSCYLPRHVIPMLPEILSNGICSLQEGVYRYCKSAFMTYDRDGAIRSETVANTLIRSTKRLTYLEAQALIDGDFNEARRHAKTPPKYTDELVDTLREFDRCAKAIQARRQRQGMISLELPECVLIYDEQGRVIDAEREDDAFTHTLIEMFMVEANEVVARLAERLGVPMLRRTHPDPAPGDQENLRKAAMVAGYRIPKQPTREELQGLINATRGSPAARAVHMAVLRTMSKAEYSPAPIGHFALASEAYAHFTSPIRRYADLTVHRVLAEYLLLTENATKRPKSEGELRDLTRDLLDAPDVLSEQELLEIGRHATMQEQNAAAAEDELRKFLVLQLLESRLGEVFPGVVTGVSPRGVFVQIDKFMIDGFIKTQDLPGDVTRDNRAPVWRIDGRTGALVDVNSGRSFQMGDTVQAAIAAVDTARRQLELVVANAEGRAAGKAKVAQLGKREAGLLGGGIGGGLGGLGAPAGSGAGGASAGSGPQGAGFAKPKQPQGAGPGKWKDKFGASGSDKRSSRSKSRDARKKNHRRDKD
jgi:ribonuclease R